jgi:hypothetical protein
LSPRQTELIAAKVIGAEWLIIRAAVSAVGEYEAAPANHHGETLGGAGVLMEILMVNAVFGRAYGPGRPFAPPGGPGAAGAVTSYP